jgi:hypothetical protein
MSKRSAEDDSLSYESDRESVQDDGVMETHDVNIPRGPIKTQTQSIAALLHRGVNRNEYYRAPSFQRPYEWAKPTVEAFLTTVFQSWNNGINPSEYFVGNITTLREPVPRNSGERISDEILVLDGHQRLTTCGIIMSAMRRLAFDYVQIDAAEKAKPEDKRSKSRQLTSAEAGDMDLIMVTVEDALGETSGKKSARKPYLRTGSKESDDYLDKVVIHFDDKNGTLAGETLPKGETVVTERYHTALTTAIAFIKEKGRADTAPRLYGFFKHFSEMIWVQHLTFEADFSAGLSIFQNINGKGQTLTEEDKIKGLILLQADKIDKEMGKGAKESPLRERVAQTWMKYEPGLSDIRVATRSAPPTGVRNGWRQTLRMIAMWRSEGDVKSYTYFSELFKTDNLPRDLLGDLVLDLEHFGSACSAFYSGNIVSIFHSASGDEVNKANKAILALSLLNDSFHHLPIGVLYACSMSDLNGVNDALGIFTRVVEALISYMVLAKTCGISHNKVKSIVDGLFKTVKEKMVRGRNLTIDGLRNILTDVIEAFRIDLERSETITSTATTTTSTAAAAAAAAAATATTITTARSRKRARMAHLSNAEECAQKIREAARDCDDKSNETLRVYILLYDLLCLSNPMPGFMSGGFSWRNDPAIHSTPGNGSLEHIHPRSTAKKTPDYDSRLVNSLGNLVVIEKSINSSASTRSALSKIEKYYMNDLTGAPRSVYPSVSSLKSIYHQQPDKDKDGTWSAACIKKREDQIVTFYAGFFRRALYDPFALVLAPVRRSQK